MLGQSFNKQTNRKLFSWNPPYSPAHHGSRPTLPLALISSTLLPTSTGCTPNLWYLTLLSTPQPQGSPGCPPPSSLPTLSPLGPSPRPEPVCLSPAPSGRPRESSVRLQVRNSGFSWRQRWLRPHHRALVFLEVTQPSVLSQEQVRSLNT